MFLGLFLLGTSAMLPAVAFAIVAAVVWGYWPGVVLSMLAANVVANLHFWVGRWVGRRRVEPWLARRGWGGAMLRESGVTTVIALRSMPLPFLAVNVAAGVSPVKGWQFAIGSALGSIPPMTVYPYFAAALIEGVDGARTEALLKALAGGALIVSLAVAPKLWRRWKRQRMVPT